MWKTHVLHIPIVWSNLYYIPLKAIFFYFANAACTIVGHAKCIQASDCCSVNEYLYCLETTCVWVCELRIDTLNISESLDGALFYLQALKSCEKATKPVYVSPGHKISIDSATELVHRCSKYRVPEPIRQVNHWFSATLILQCQYGNLCGFFKLGFIGYFNLIHFYK